MHDRSSRFDVQQQRAGSVAGCATRVLVAQDRRHVVSTPFIAVEKPKELLAAAIGIAGLGWQPLRVAAKPSAGPGGPGPLESAVLDTSQNLKVSKRRHHPT